MSVSGLILLGFLLKAQPAPAREGRPATPRFAGCSCACNCDRPEKDCVNCVQAGQFSYCLDSIYGGSCNCTESGLGCATGGVCCVWV